MTSPLRFYPKGSGEPRADLALEEEFLLQASSGEPSLFSFSWSSPVLVLGYGQEAKSVNLAACHRLGVPVYRRITGGTGVLHQHAISLGLALPAAHPWCHSIASLYDGFVETLRGALAQSGLPTERGTGTAKPGSSRSPICFEEIVSESLLWEGRKVFGGAQARRARSCLVHGTLLFGVEPAFQATIYGVAQTRIEASLGALPPIESESLQTGLGIAFSSALGLDLRPMPAAPVPAPALLARYTTRRWAPLAEGKA